MSREEKLSSKLNGFGRVKARLIRDLAMGEKSLKQLASEYGVVVSAVHGFRKRWAHEIAAAQADLANEFSALWVANKFDRVSSYQHDIEEIDARHDGSIADALDAYVAAGADAELKAQRAEELVDLLKGLDPALLAAKHRALRAVAEELGALPSRMQVQVGDMHVTHVLEGVDLDKL